METTIHEARQHLCQQIIANNIDSVANLVEYTTINQPITDDTCYPMHLCAQHNYTDMLMLFLRRGALVNVQNDMGYTPLHLACLEGNEEVVDLLLRSGSAMINAPNKRKITPLMVAAWYQRTAILELLLSNSAATELYSDDGLQALHYATLTDHTESIATLLAHTKGNNKNKTGDEISWQDIMRLREAESQLLALDPSPPPLSVAASNKKLDIMLMDDKMPSVRLVIDGSDDAILHANKEQADIAFVDDDLLQTAQTPEMHEDYTMTTTQDDTPIAVTDSDDETKTTDTSEHAQTASEADAITAEVLSASGEQQLIADIDSEIDETPTNEHAKAEFGEYSFDEQQLQQEISTRQTTNYAVVSNSNDPSAAGMTSHNTIDRPLAKFSATDTFDVSKGFFRTIGGYYTNNFAALTIHNLLAALGVPYELDRSMQGTVTPGEQKPKFTFFDRNGNVIVWEILEYDPFDSDNVSTWNKTKLWYQNNGFSYDVNFFMSYFNHQALDSRDIYNIIQSIKQQI